MTVYFIATGTYISRAVLMFATHVPRLSDAILNSNTPFLHSRPANNFNSEVDGPAAQGSRMDWEMPRNIPPIRYIATDRLPTLMSPVRVMPGIRRKFAGTPRK